MGLPDEQHQELGTGNREESGNIRLEYYDRNHEDKSLPFFGGDDISLQNRLISYAPAV